MPSAAVGAPSQVLTKALGHEREALVEVSWVSLPCPTLSCRAGGHSLVEKVEANAIMPLADDVIAEGR